MRNTIEKAKELLLGVLFPEICAACRNPLERAARDRGICHACLELADIKTALTCPACGARLAENKKTCHKDFPYRLAAASSYDNTVIQKLIRELKYGRRTAYARPLAGAIAAHFKNLGFDFSSYEIVPVPLHRSRERERGFNQSQIIAEFLSEMAGIPVAANVLARTRNTPSQAELPREARLTNVAGSFAVKSGSKIPKHVVLLDDVFTSGATVDAAARALRAGGAARIIAVVAAKA